MSDRTIQFIGGALLVVGILVAVVVLGWHGILDKTQVFGILTTIVTIAGTILAAGHGATTATKAITAAQATNSAARSGSPDA